MAGFHWYYDTLTPRMAAFTVVVDEVLEHIVEEFAGKVEDYAKETAPWEDRSGAARDGLTAEYVKPLTIILYHTVDYGIWLEVRNAGEYAVILPTIEHMGPQLMGELAIGGAGL